METRKWGAAVGIGAVIAGAIFLLSKRKAEAVPKLPVDTREMSPAELRNAYAEQGYSGTQLEVIVEAVTNYNQEIARIENQPPTTSQSEALRGEQMAAVQVSSAVTPEAAVATVAQQAAAQGITYTPEMIAALLDSTYKSLQQNPGAIVCSAQGQVWIQSPVTAAEAVPKTIYGTPVTTQAEALEAANREYQIASMQTDPAIRSSMMAIAEAWYAAVAGY